MVEFARWLWSEPLLPLIPLTVLAFWRIERWPDEVGFLGEFDTAVMFGATICIPAWFVFGHGIVWLRAIVCLALAEIVVRRSPSFEIEFLGDGAANAIGLAAALRWIVGIRVEKRGRRNSIAASRQYSLRTIFSLMAVVALFGGFLNRHRSQFSIDLGRMDGFLQMMFVSATGMLVILGVLASRPIAIASCLLPTVAAFGYVFWMGEPDFPEVALILNLISLAVALPTFIVRLYGYRVVWAYWFVRWNAKIASSATSDR